MSENARGRAGGNLSTSKKPTLTTTIVTQKLPDASARAILIDFGQTGIEAATTKNLEVWHAGRAALGIACGEVARLLR